MTPSSTRLPRWLAGLTAILLCCGVGSRLTAPAADAAEPQVNFQASPSRGEVPLTVQFNDTTEVAGGHAVSWAWDFGDGQSSAERNPRHTYAAPGKYSVTLTVTDDHGHVGQKLDRDSITVDPPRLVAAALPVSRSVVVGAPATAFVSVINAGKITAPGVTIQVHPSTAPGGVPGAPLPAVFTFQTTDPLTNLVTGSANAPVDILPGESQSFVVSLVPTAPLEPVEVRFRIQGAQDSTDPARIVSGLNTVLLSASATPVPDIVAVASIIDGTPAVEVPGPAGATSFAVATANVGAGGDITVSADTGALPLPLGLAVCETNPATGQCVSAVAPAIATRIEAGATPTFGVFVTGAGGVPYDPERHRIFLRFRDEGGALRGATSVAVKTR